MSEQNGKVCCNCRHDIRTKDKSGDIKNTCDIDGSYIGYVKCMEGWCRHWSKDKEVNNDRKDCPYRQEENGNCLPVGGFCLAVTDDHCKYLKEVENG